ELVLLLELPLGAPKTLIDLTAALGGTCAESPFELVERRRLHEDRHAVRHLTLDRERALGLEVEQWRLSRGADPPDLRPERAHALPPLEVDVLEELARVEPALELVVRDEVVLPPLTLTLAPLARRCGNGELQLGDPRQNRTFERALAGTRGTGNDDDRSSG